MKAIPKGGADRTPLAAPHSAGAPTRRNDGGSAPETARGADLPRALPLGTTPGLVGARPMRIDAA
jgi:hypothetical protein